MGRQRTRTELPRLSFTGTVEPISWRLPGCRTRTTGANSSPRPMRFKSRETVGRMSWNWPCWQRNEESLSCCPVTSHHRERVAVKRGTACSRAPRFSFVQSNRGLTVFQIEGIQFVGSPINQHYDAVVGCELEPPSPAKDRTQDASCANINHFFRLAVGYAVTIDLVRTSHYVHVTAVVRPPRPTDLGGVWWTS